MPKFSLIQRLNTNPSQSDPQIPRDIDYTEYSVNCHSGDVTVLIPVRECKSFEQQLQQYVVLLHEDVRQLVRNHRGIMG